MPPRPPPAHIAPPPPLFDHRSPAPLSSDLDINEAGYMGLSKSAGNIKFYGNKWCVHHIMMICACTRVVRVDHRPPPPCNSSPLPPPPPFDIHTPKRTWWPRVAPGRWNSSSAASSPRLSSMCVRDGGWRSPAPTVYSLLPPHHPSHLHTHTRAHRAGRDVGALAGESVRPLLHRGRGPIVASPSPPPSAHHTPR